MEIVRLYVHIDEAAIVIKFPLRSKNHSGEALPYFIQRNRVIFLVKLPWL